MQKPTDAKGSIMRSVRHCKDMLTHPLQYTISNRLINVKTAPVCLQKTLDDNITLEVIKVMHYADLSILGLNEYLFTIIFICAEFTVSCKIFDLGCIHNI